MSFGKMKRSAEIVEKMAGKKHPYDGPIFKAIGALIEESRYGTEDASVDFMLPKSPCQAEGNILLKDSEGKMLTIQVICQEIFDDDGTITIIRDCTRDKVTLFFRVAN